MSVLVLNSGSSSIKYRLFDSAGEISVASGTIEQIGEGESLIRHRAGERGEEIVDSIQLADHRAGFEQVLATLGRSDGIGDSEGILAIGHRVVHGGETFRQPTRIDERVTDAIREQIRLAPLHNPGNLMGIEVARERLPDVPQVAVFDTAFHQTMPPHAVHYALPLSLQRTHRLRRYGFHGISHRYVTGRSARFLGCPPDRLNLITLHLGNGASAAAIRDGRSVDTSMGLSPLEGLIMGTRGGDLDPAIPSFLMRETGRSADQVDGLLNAESGLKGICGQSDMRTIERSARDGDERCQLALEMYAYRIRKYIGSYLAVLGRVDAVVFTAGIGENSHEIRARSCEGLSALGIEIDPARNEAVSREEREIQGEGSRVKILVIPTNEELEIARETLACLRASG